MIRSCAHEELTENFCSWKMRLEDELSHLRSLTSSLRGEDVRPSFRASPPHSLLLLWRLALEAIPSLSCTESSRLSFPFRNSFLQPVFLQLLLILSPDLLKQTFWKNRLFSPSLLSTTCQQSRLPCLPSIPPKLLSVCFGNLLIAQCIFQTFSS